MTPRWLEWARELQAIAQNGLTFNENQFDIERYKAISRIAAEILSEHSGLEHKKIENIFANEEGYATPKIDVRGVCFRDDKVLLVKEKIDGGWTLPGGWADPNESPSESVEREVFEESGFKVKAEKLIAFYDRDKQGHFPPYPYHIYKAFFLCRIIGGNNKASNETDDVDFFGGNEIPNLSYARTTINQLNDFFNQHKTGNWITKFD